MSQETLTSHYKVINQHEIISLTRMLSLSVEIFFPLISIITNARIDQTGRSSYFVFLCPTQGRVVRVFLS